MAYKKVNTTDTILRFRNSFNGVSKFVGDSDSLLTTQDSDLVGAINEIEGVFDASANKINSTGLIIDDAGDITLDAAGDDIIFMDAGAERWRVNLDASPSLEATGDASISGSGNLTIDAVTDITLDADDGDIFLKDGGVQFGSLTNTSGNLIIKSGSTTAATFSGADVTFASDVTVTDNLIVNGNTTLGNAATDTVTITADVASDILPSADGTYDLGAVGSEWQDLYIDGTANIDSLVADTADINGGTIDGTTIGGSSAAAITGTTIDGTTITATTSLVSPKITRTGDFTIDASGDIVLDADGSDVLLKDAGTQFGALTNTSGNLIIKSGTTTALTFSGANITTAGTVTPAGGLTTTAQDFAGAINEINTAVELLDSSATVNAASLGILSSLTTTDKSTLVAAINEVDAGPNTLGTPASGTLTNCTGLPVSTGISGLGSNVATLLATPSYSNLTTAVTDFSEGVQDLIGAMFSGNTETDITVTYQDGDGTIDLVVGTLNQNTTGNAATATALETARTIGLSGDVTATGVSFDGTGNITLSTTIAANSVALGTDTTGNYVGTITAGTGLASTGATSGEGIAHTLSVDLDELTTSTSNGDGDYFVVVDTVGAQKKLTKANINNSEFNNDAGYTTNTGTVTSVAVSAGAGLSGGGTITTSGTISLAVDLNELTTSTSNGDGDYFVVVDTSGVERKLTKANISLSGFNNNSGWTSNTGTVTSVAVSAGAGLDGGGTITTSGTINLSIEADLRGDVSYIGPNTLDYHYISGTTHDFYLDGSLNMRLYNGDGDLHVNGDLIAYSTAISDQKFKDNVMVIENALDKVERLRGVEFDWNATSRKGEHDMGLIAQEVEEIIPHIVREKTLQTGEFEHNPTQSKSIDYEKLTALLIEAVKELSARVKELEGK